MAIRCPHCEFEMALKGARPGRFAPRCQNCGQTFGLVIPDDPSIAPTVMKLETPPVAAAPMASGGEGGNGAPTNPPATKTPTRIGGYEIVQKIGEGSIGTLYSAREAASEDRIALKVLAEDLAADAPFVARFTREAFATAQLKHPNLVNVLDVGAFGRTHFLAMEMIEGESLANTIARVGRLDAETAAAYTLQAARGLKFAHDRGMIHRDVRPDNLLVNDQGNVKVADLGVVKQPDLRNEEATGMNPRARRFQNTLANLAAGTPAFMAPEQSQDAMHTDSRVDIYSLGCTAYNLLTGRPPFMGRTAIEIITRHQREQPVPPEMIVRDVPAPLSAIVMRMLAKRPQERYQSMGEVIRALEDFLGVAEAGPFAPRAEQIRTLESATRQFSRSGWALLRRQLILGFYLVCAAGALGLWIFGHPSFAAGMIGLAVTTTIAYYAIVGVVERTYLFTRVRQVVTESSLLDRITWAVVGCAILLGLVVIEWFIPWLGASLAAVLVALGFHFTIDQILQRDRRRPLGDVQTMLRQLRARGVDESKLRLFVCDFGGDQWEEFFESIFGYPAKLEVRKLRSGDEALARRPKYGAWRDPILRWAERKLAARQLARQRQMLVDVETRALIAEGRAPADAGKQARETTRRVFDAARRLRDGAPQKKAEPIPLPARFTAVSTPGASTAAAQAPPKESIMNIINRVSAETIQDAIDSPVEEEEDEAEREHLSWFQRRFGSPIDLLIGKQVRLILAVVILAGFGMWWRQNKVAQALEAAAQVASSQRQISVAANPTEITRSAVEVVMQSGEAAVERTGVKVLDIPHVPRPICLALSGWNAGLAGLILLLSVPCYGRLMSLTILLAAAIALVGHWFEIPNVGTPLPWMSAAAAGGLAFIGLFFLRRPEGI